MGTGIRVCVMVALTSALLTSSASGRTPVSRGHGPDSSPNILLIITDDQRVETLTAMPNTQDAFMKEGTSYAEAYTVTNACCPSRASIFTGQYPHNHGVITNADAEKLDQDSTVQRYLDDAGYNTALAGKYLNRWSEVPPHFDRFASLQDDPSGYYFGGSWNVDGTVRTVNSYSTDFIGRQSRRFLKDFEAVDSTPWFMVLTPTAPHLPTTPEESFRWSPVEPWEGDPAVFEEDRSDKPPYVQESETSIKDIKRTRRRQIRTLLSVDELVAGVDSLLDRLEEGEHTLAFYVSDSGTLWGEHGLMGKANPYTPAAKVPFMIRWSEHFSAGTTSHELVATIDIAPTILEAVGLVPEVDKPMDGNSLLEPGGHQRLLLTNPARRTFSTRTLTYQFVQNRNQNEVPDFEEYYDLFTDPYQLLNLLGDPDDTNDPDNLAMLRLQLAADRICRGELCP